MSGAQSLVYEKKLSTDKLSNILEEDENIRKKLVEIYDDVKLFLSEKPDATWDSEISARYTNYRMQLENFPKDLAEDERPIVVAGETGAGKSSVLNLLIGFNVFPTSILACTGVICRLRTSKTKKADIIDFNEKIVQTIEMKDDNEKKFSEDLSGYISPEEHRDEHQVKYVDIYWPIPFLTKNIIVVDTPGIGESKEMTDRLVQYLPNAVALIYVIDPTHAGGIANDRIVALFEAMQGQDINGMRQAFDPSCTMFICNKWDVVDEKEEVKVYKHIKDKLETFWPKMQEKQIVRFSAKKILKKMNRQHTPPPEFLKFRRGIEELIEVSLFAKSRQHILWLEKFLMTIQMNLTAHLKNMLLSESQRERQANRGEELLKMLQDCKDTRGGKLRQEANDLCERLTNSIINHLHAKNTKERMFAWQKNEVKFPDHNDYSKIKEKADTIIAKIVSDEINNFWQESRGQNDIESLIVKVREEEEVIRKTRCDLEQVLQNPDGVDDVKPQNFDWTRSYYGDTGIDKEMAVIAITSPLWIPFVLVGGLIGVPVNVAVKAVKNKVKVMKYNHDKEKFMTKWANNYLETYTGWSVRYDLKEKMFGKLFKKLNEVFEDDLSQIISGSKKLFDNLQTEARSTKSIPERYQPKLEKCNQILEKLHALSPTSTYC